MFDWIYDYAYWLLYAAWVYLRNSSFELTKPLWEQLFDNLPDLPTQDMSTAYYGYSLMDQWFPMAELFGFVLAYWTFVCAYAAYRHVKTWIPLVSG